MEKKIGIGLFIVAIIGVIFVVASKSEEKPLFGDQEKIDTSLYNVEEDAEVPDGQQAEVEEKVGQLDLENNKDNMQQTKTNKSLPKPEFTLDTNKTYSVTLQTSEGNIVVELDAQDTPITANNFVYLSENDFYDNTIFHRVIDGFMIQGGDPQGTGMGGPGYKFEDEPVTKDYTRGTIAMANSGPNTNGSQFFIMHADYPLPKNYVIFGKVVEGIDVVDKIATSEVKASFSGEQSSPVNPVTIIDTTVTTK